MFVKVPGSRGIKAIHLVRSAPGVDTWLAQRSHDEWTRNWANYTRKGGNSELLDGLWKNMFEGGSLWAGVLAGGLNQLQDTVAFRGGRMKKDEYAICSARN